MRKSIFSIFFITIIFVFSAIFPALADEGEEMARGGGGFALQVLIQLITLIVVGGILYNLLATVSGFGGLIGKALKFIGAGVLFLSLETLDQLSEHIIGYGSENIFGEGIAHNIAHHSATLIGFFFLAWGLMNFAKIVKVTKA